MPKRYLPDFICVGASKTGTNTLFQCLSEHPQICMPKHLKGLRFFDQFYERGLTWYTSFFTHCDKDSLKGEISETYLSNKLVPERIFKNLPEAKIIMTFRNPYSRTFSDYLQLTRLGKIRGSFDQAVLNYDNLIFDSLYFEHMQNYLKFFPRNNILIMFFEELQENPLQFVKDIYTFLDIDSSFLPKSLYNYSNVTTMPRSRFFSRFSYSLYWFLRKKNMLSLISFAKQNSLVRKLLFKAPEKDRVENIQETTKEYLYNHFQPEIDKLSHFLEKDLSHWKFNNQ